MSDMIKRMARAICESVGGDPDMLIAGAPLWMQYRKCAKAALTPLLDPTPEMVEAGVSEMFRKHGNASGPMLVEYYSIMIDAAKGGSHAD